MGCGRDALLPKNMIQVGEETSLYPGWDYKIAREWAN